MINAKPSRNEIPKENLSDNSQEEANISDSHTIAGINRLPLTQKRLIYSRLIPKELIDQFHLTKTFSDSDGNNLLMLNCNEGSPVAEMALYHQIGFTDPILYGQITDTVNGQVHVLLYIMNDPESPRFDVDRMPDGTPTKWGTKYRNIQAEKAAMEHGLAPGQIRRGLHLMGEAVEAFETFVSSLGNEMYFVEPLYYHNAIIFEHYGFAYEKGRRLMLRINDGFSDTGDLTKQLDGSSPFRSHSAAQSIRLRSWAIHDNILGEPFTGVTMYKHIGKKSGVSTVMDCSW